MSRDVAEKAVYVCECMCVYCCLSSLSSFLLSSFFFVLLRPYNQKTPNNTQALHNTHSLIHTQKVLSNE